MCGVKGLGLLFGDVPLCAFIFVGVVCALIGYLILPSVVGP